LSDISALNPALTSLNTVFCFDVVSTSGYSPLYASSGATRAPKILTALYEEKIVSWNTSANDTFVFALPTEAMDDIASGLFLGMPKDRTPVYVCRDNVTDSVLFYMRLNRQGFLSADNGTTALQIPLNSVSFAYHSTISVYNRLPVAGPVSRLMTLSLADKGEPLPEAELLY